MVGRYYLMKFIKRSPCRSVLVTYIGISFYSLYSVLEDYIMAFELFWKSKDSGLLYYSCIDDLSKLLLLRFWPKLAWLSWENGIKDEAFGDTLWAPLLPRRLFSGPEAALLKDRYCFLVSLILLFLFLKSFLPNLSFLQLLFIVPIENELK